MPEISFSGNDIPIAVHGETRNLLKVVPLYLIKKNTGKLVFRWMVYTME